MNIKKLPLAQRLERLAQDRPAYLEYAAAIIRHIASMPITSYMADCAAALEQLGPLLGLSQEQVNAMTYQDVAARVNGWYVSYTADQPQRHTAALQAVELLAAPLLREYQMYGPPSADSDLEEL